MKHKSKYVVIVFLAIASFINLPAQTSEWQTVKPTIDSSQRVWMQQTLGVKDAVITQVFAIRDNMNEQVSVIRNSKTIAEKEQDNQVLTIKKNTEAAIRAALGETAYQLYTERIRQRLQRTGNTDKLPLTGTGN